MTLNQEWFATHASTSGGVLLGNDHICKVVSVGTMKIKMHDGVIRTLMIMKHIPEMLVASSKVKIESLRFLKGFSH